MKIIFLDIDGVLTTATWHRFHKFNPVCSKLLENVLVSSGEWQLVISSTWRYEGLGENSKLEKELKETNLFKWLHPDWRTPRLNKKRGYEIQDWIDKHSEISDYLILDDDSDMLEHQMASLIHTDCYDGMLFRHWERLMNLMGLKFSDLIIQLP